MLPRAQVPLPGLAEEALEARVADVAARAPASPDALPSAAFFTFVNTRQALTAVAFSPDARLVVGARGACRQCARVPASLWRDSAQLRRRPPVRAAHYSPSAAASPGGGASVQSSSCKYLILCSQIAEVLRAGLSGCFADSSVRVCDVPATAAARAAPGRDPDGQEPAPAAPPPAAAALWGHAGPVYAADLSDDGQALFTASGDGTVRLWSTELWANLVAYRRAPGVWLGWVRVRAYSQPYPTWSCTGARPQARAAARVAAAGAAVPQALHALRLVRIGQGWALTLTLSECQTHGAPAGATTSRCGTWRPGRRGCTLRARAPTAPRACGPPSARGRCASSQARVHARLVAGSDAPAGMPCKSGGMLRRAGPHFPSAVHPERLVHQSLYLSEA